MTSRLVLVSIYHAADRNAISRPWREARHREPSQSPSVTAPPKGEPRGGKRHTVPKTECRRFFVVSLLRMTSTCLVCHSERMRRISNVSNNQNPTGGDTRPYNARMPAASCKYPISWEFAYRNRHSSFSPRSRLRGVPCFCDTIRFRAVGLDHWDDPQQVDR